jgi:hypothetical protein
MTKGPLKKSMGYGFHSFLQLLVCHETNTRSLNKRLNFFEKIARLFIHDNKGGILCGTVY